MNGSVRLTNSYFDTFRLEVTQADLDKIGAANSDFEFALVESEEAVQCMMDRDPFINANYQQIKAAIEYHYPNHNPIKMSRWDKFLDMFADHQKEKTLIRMFQLSYTALLMNEALKNLDAPFQDKRVLDFQHRLTIIKNDLRVIMGPGTDVDFEFQKNAAGRMVMNLKVTNTFNEQALSVPLVELNNYDQRDETYYKLFVSPAPSTEEIEKRALIAEHLAKLDGQVQRLSSKEEGYFDATVSTLLELERLGVSVTLDLAALDRIDFHISYQGITLHSSSKLNNFQGFTDDLAKSLNIKKDLTEADRKCLVKDYFEYLNKSIKETTTLNERVNRLEKLSAQISTMTTFFSALNSLFSKNEVSTEVLGRFTGKLEDLMLAIDSLRGKMGGIYNLERQGTTSGVHFHISKNENGTYKIELVMTKFPAPVKYLVHANVNPEIVHGFTAFDNGENNQHGSNWLQDFTGIKVVKDHAIIKEERRAKREEQRAKLKAERQARLAEFYSSNSFLTPALPLDLLLVSKLPGGDNPNTRTGAINSYFKKKRPIDSSAEESTKNDPAEKSKRKHKTRFSKFEDEPPKLPVSKSLAQRPTSDPSKSKVTIPLAPITGSKTVSQKSVPKSDMPTSTPEVQEPSFWSSMSSPLADITSDPTYQPYF